VGGQEKEGNFPEGIKGGKIGGRTIFPGNIYKGGEAHFWYKKQGFV